MKYYHFGLIQKYIILFSKIFNDIHLHVSDSENSIKRDVRVPITYADKNKQYMKLNSNLESTGMKLPIMSIYMDDMQYDERRQKNPMYGHDYIQKVDNSIKKYVENPAPYTLRFTVTVWTRKSTDMFKILEQVLPMFKPSKTYNVNILPEMNLSLEIPIVYIGLSNESIREYEDSADTFKMSIYTMTFKLHGWLFDPIKDMTVVKELEARLENSIYNITDEYSHDDIINNKLITVTDIDLKMIREFTITPTEDKEKYNYFIDLTTEIAAEGEKLSISDKDGSDYPFVYEYSNGEFYGSDSLIPNSLSITKTGNVCILIDELEANVEKTFFVNTSLDENYEFAKDVFNIYVDFNRNIMRDMHIENKTSNDYIYINDSSMKIKTVDGGCKVFTNNSLGGSNKTFKIGFDSLTFEGDKYICGIHTQNDENYIYLKTSATLQEVEIHEVVNGSDTVISNIAVNDTISYIIFDFDSDLTIDVDSITHTFTPANDYIIPYINWNGLMIASADYVYAYRK